MAAGSARATVGLARFRLVCWTRAEPGLAGGRGWPYVSYGRASEWKECGPCRPGCWLAVVECAGGCWSAAQAEAAGAVSVTWDSAQTVVRCRVAVRAMCVCGAALWRLCGVCHVLQGHARVQGRRTRGQPMAGIITGVRARMAVLGVAALEPAGSGVGVERAARTAIGGSRRAFFAHD